MDVCLLIARRGRHRRQHTAETGTIIAKDFITEDYEYLSNLLQERHKQENRTNYPSDWSQIDTEQEDESEGSELRKQSCIDSGGGSTVSRTQPSPPWSAESRSSRQQNHTVDNAGRPDPQFQRYTTEDTRIT